jgi:hypothetical protein
MSKAIFKAMESNQNADLAPVESMRSEWFYGYHTYSGRLDKYHFGLSHADGVFSLSSTGRNTGGFTRYIKSEHQLDQSEMRTELFAIQRSIFDGDNWIATKEYQSGDLPQKISIDFWVVKSEHTNSGKRFGIMNGKLTRQSKYEIERKSTSYGGRAYYTKMPGEDRLYRIHKKSDKHLGSVTVNGWSSKYLSYRQPKEDEEEAPFGPIDFSFDAIRTSAGGWAPTKRISPLITAAYISICKKYEVDSFANADMTTDEFIKEFAETLRSYKCRTLKDRLSNYNERIICFEGTDWNYQALDVDIQKLFQQEPNLYYEYLNHRHNVSVHDGLTDY